MFDRSKIDAKGIEKKPASRLTKKSGRVGRTLPAIGFEVSEIGFGVNFIWTLI